MSSVVIRKSNLNDINDITKLIYYTEESPNEEWGGHCQKECLENIKNLIKNRGSRYNLKYIWVAERNGEILGIIVMIPYNKLNKLSIKTGLITTKFLTGIKNKVSYMLSTFEYILFKEYKNGTLYVSNIAISPKARGLGIGKLLMKFSESQAKFRGYNGVSLMPKSQDLCEFYEKLEYHKIFDRILLGERVIKMAKFI